MLGILDKRRKFLYNGVTVTHEQKTAPQALPLSYPPVDSVDAQTCRQSGSDDSLHDVRSRPGEVWHSIESCREIDAAVRPAPSLQGSEEAKD